MIVCIAIFFDFFLDLLIVLAEAIGFKVILDQLKLLISRAMPFLDDLDGERDAEIEGKDFFVLVDEGLKEEVVPLEG
jgi:hypothetical protein